MVFAAVARGAVVDADYHKQDMWGPADSVHALDAVIAAVDKVANNKHLTPERRARAQHVAEDIKKDIEAVEGGNLTKQQAHERVGHAMQELSAFEAELMNQTAQAKNTEDRIAMLKKRLADKQAELAKDKSLMKLLKLKKELVEKKLMLQNLLAQKAASEGGHDATETASLVKNLVAMGKAGMNKTSLERVQAREKEVADGLAKMDAKHTKNEGAFKAFNSGNATRETKMLKMLKSQEKRIFKKARALKQEELNELKEAEASVKQGDVARLRKVLGKIEHEGDAKSGKFLH